MKFATLVMVFILSALSAIAAEGHAVVWAVFLGLQSIVLAGRYWILLLLEGIEDLNIKKF